MKQLDNYFKAINEIYDYFGFKESWSVYPIDDRRDYWWYYNDFDVHFFDTKEAYENDDDSHSYSDEILRHRFYPNPIMIGEEYTMIMVNTHVDGNVFLAIYDNSKKI
jgi:hypothetical protein